MDIYTYAGFAYGLTAIISLGTVGLILLVNSLMNWAVRQAKSQKQAAEEAEKIIDADTVANSTTM